jgi:hypothetical protein
MPVRPPLAILFALAAACAAPPRFADRADDPALDARVREVVAGLGAGVRAAVWLGPAQGVPALAWNVEQPLPCASAIKAAYLVELFAARADALDDPLPGTDTALAAAHPAAAHFAAAQREAARTALGTASARRIGEAMVTGKGVDNATYNLAANVVTAFFGGPAALEQRLRARSPRWSGLHVRRYMLADRTANGDNEVTAHSLAAVHGALAARAVPGVAPAAVDACRAVLARGTDAQGRAAFAKGGSLDSEPVTRVDAGWREGTDGGALVYAVVLVQDGVAAAERPAAGKSLAAATRTIRELLLAPR